MTENKLRKIVTACAVAGTVLLVFLLTFLIYQFITIGVMNKREKKLTKEINELQQVIEDQEQDAQYYESLTGKDWLAYQMGFVRGEK
ncbi:MAG: hypothetical protein IJV85_01460 [Clostridia bacterium]|nr:hypothetical protein [Clostridia bacterium]